MLCMFVELGETKKNPGDSGHHQLDAITIRNMKLRPGAFNRSRHEIKKPAFVLKLPGSGVTKIPEPKALQTLRAHKLNPKPQDQRPSILLARDNADARVLRPSSPTCTTALLLKFAIL